MVTPILINDADQKAVGRGGTRPSAISPGAEQPGHLTTVLPYLMCSVTQSDEEQKTGIAEEAVEEEPQV